MKRIDRTGEVHETRFGKLKIVKYENAMNCTIKFLRTKTVINNVQYSTILRKNIRDPMAPVHFERGYMGIGKYTADKNNKHLYYMWIRVLRRCYDSTFHSKNPTYADCKMVNRWHNFQNFCEDIIKMANWNVKGFDLDKDFRVFGNKKYGPKYCSFVPEQINCSRSGIKAENYR